MEASSEAMQSPFAPVALTKESIRVRGKLITVCPGAWHGFDERPVTFLLARQPLGKEIPPLANRRSR